MRFINKYFLLLVFAPISLISTSHSAFADIPNHYLIHARLELKDGSFRIGYLDVVTDCLPILKDEAGYFYHSVQNRCVMRLQPVDSSSAGWRPSKKDYHFHRDLLFTIDGVELFDSAKVVTFTHAQGNEVLFLRHVAMLGSPTKIDKDEIASWEVESVLPVSLYADGKFTVGDGSWIRPQATFQEDIGGFELCDFTVAGFQKQTGATKALLKKLRALFKEYKKLEETGKLDEYYSRQYALIEKLRREHVLVFSFCYC